MCELKQVFVQPLVLDAFKRFGQVAPLNLSIYETLVHASAEIQVWDGDSWQVMVCIPPHEIKAVELIEVIKKGLGEKIDPRQLSIFSPPTSVFFSNHFEPSSDMKDIAL